jgi:HlyD family secretion protein
MTMKVKTIAMALTVSVALAGLTIWAFAPRPVEVETGVVSKGPFERSINEDGKTQLKDRYVVSAPLAGRLTRIRLEEGDAVKLGQVVAVLTPTLAPMLDDRTMREQSARVETANAMWQRARARVQRAAITVEMANEELKRTEKLATQGFVSSSKVDTDRLSARALVKELESAEQERHAAEHDLEQARAALAAVRPGAASARGFEVKSPISGRVLKVLQSSEVAVNQGAPLLELGDLSRLEVLVETLTTDALQLKPGTPVAIERWGGVGELRGHVHQVFPAAFTKVSALGVEEQRVNVIIDIDTSPEQWQSLGDGFRVGVRMIVTSLTDALQVPVSAVFPVPNQVGTFGVFVVQNSRAVLTPVKVQARNGETAWIDGGIEKGVQVIVYPPHNVTENSSVRVRSMK